VLQCSCLFLAFRLVTKEIAQQLSARVLIMRAQPVIPARKEVPQVLDPKFPILGGFPDSAIAITYICLLAQGQTAFDGVDAMRRDPTFARALGLPSLPSAPTVRQRIEARGQEWLPHLSDANVRLLKRSGVKPTDRRVVAAWVNG